MNNTALLAPNENEFETMFCNELTLLELLEIEDAILESQDINF